MKNHGGYIAVESEVGRGTIIHICLPATLAVPVEDQPRPARIPVAGSGRVLVLDDEESLRMLLQEGLSAQGLRVDGAATTEEALAHLGRSSYDVFLCDLHLSSGGYTVDGREAASRILEAAGKQKPLLVYMTGDLLESTPGAAGGNEPICLQKPFRISDVLDILREVLSAPAETRHS